MKSIASVSLLAVALGVSACGSKNQKTATAIIDAANYSEFSAQTTSEAISAASAGDSEGGSGFGLMLAESGSPFKSSSRTCVVQPDGSALVTISSELSFDKTSGNDKVSRTNKMSGTSTEKRLWSHPQGVQCLNAEKAKVNLKSDPTSYGLKVTIERTRQQTMSMNNLRKNTSISSSRSFSMNGERSVSIVSYREDSASGTSVQEKKISGSMNRSFSFVDKDGQTKTGSFSSATVGDPMLVKVTRSLSSKEVLSRELVSGVRKNTLVDGTSIELSFNNFVMSGAGESCEAQSGSVALKYLDAQGNVSKTINCSADSGLLSCTDSSGAAVELESPSCDPSDDK